MMRYFLLTLCCLFFYLHGCPQKLRAQIDNSFSIRVNESRLIASQFGNSPIVEPHVSAHPKNENYLLIAAMVVHDVERPYESCQLLTFTSTDGGNRWTEEVHNWFGYDPWTAIDEKGNAIMTWLGTKGSFRHEFPVQFFSSKDQGLNWSPDVQTERGLGYGHDGTKVVAYKNSFYFTTVTFNTSMGADVFLYEKVEDHPFKIAGKVEGKGIRLNFCEPAVLSSGDVLVPSSHFLSKLWISRYSQESGLSEKQLVTMNSGGAGGYIHLVADNNHNSPFRDYVYFVRALGRNNQYEGIWLNISKNGGKDWSPDTRIDLFDKLDGGKAIVPSIAINESGVIGISWVDSQNATDPLAKDIYFTASIDGGQSFHKPVRITADSSNPFTDRNGLAGRRFSGGGHYLGIVAKANRKFQLVWSDSRSGVFQLYSCEVEVLEGI